MSSIEALLARPFVTRIGWGLLHSLWEVAAVAVVAAVVLRALRRRSPQVRYLVGCGALGLMAVLPAATAWLDGAEVYDAPAVVVDRSQVAPAERDPAPEDAAEVGGNLPADAGVRSADRVAPLLPWLVAAWAAGVFVLSIRLAGGWVLVQRLARNGAQPVGADWGEAFQRLCTRLAVTRPVRLLESASVRVPMVVGWLRPAVLLPVSALTGLTPDQLEAILAHELAHVRRHDYLVNLVQSVAETLLFYHPAVWWLGRRIREERELCCDDVAVIACGDRLAYARALTAMEGLRSGVWSLAPSAGGKPFLARVRRLLGVPTVDDRPAGGLAGLLVLAAVAALGLTVVLAPGATPASAADEAKPPIVGTVVNPDGTPAEGATVWLVDMSFPGEGVVTLGRVRSEAGGRFRLARPTDGDDETRRGGLFVWAYRPGAGPALAVLRKDRTEKETAGPVRLKLEPAATAAVRVVDPRGRPVAGVPVALHYFHNGPCYVPGELAILIGATTDAAGRATLKAAPEEVEMVRVTTKAHGTQVFHKGKGLDRPVADLQLRPVSRVEGRVTSADPAAVRGLKVHLSTLPKDRSRGMVYGRAEAVTDDAGRFTVPAVVAGELHVDVPAPKGSLERALRPAVTDLEGKPRVELAIPLKRLVRIRGVVRESGAGTPVADAVVRFFSYDAADQNSMPPTRTDAAGHFEALAMPGAQALMSIVPPKAYLGLTSAAMMRVAEEDGQTLTPIEVERAATLPGRVVDEAGKPVPGVTVQGTWDAPRVKTNANPPMFVRNQGIATATSDAGGRFLLEGFPHAASVSMEVSGGDAHTDGPQLGKPLAAEPVTLRVSKSNAVALSGRVVDPDGRPIAGALVLVRTRPADRDGLTDLPGLGPNDIDGLRTGPDGRFRTPRSVRRGYAYSALARADGRLSDNTPWLVLAPTTDPTLPDLTLLGLRTVRGRVVDDRGRPVDGAIVRVTGDAPTPVRATTDAQGRFALAGVVEGRGFLFVEKPGFRFQGHMFGPGAGEVVVPLVRGDVPPTERLETLPPATPRAEELALLHRVLDPYSEKALAKDANEARYTVLPILIRAEPAAMLGRIDREGFVDASTRDALRGRVALRLLRDEPADALIQLEAIRDVSSRSHTLYQAASASPPVERALRLDLLNRALVATRTLGNESQRAIQLAMIGEQYLAVGEPGRAAEVEGEAEKIARQLGENGRDAYARGTVAEGLAPLNLPAALELIRGTQADPEHDDHLGRMAQALAGRDPAGSERVLMMMRDGRRASRDNYALRVCHGMAAVDRARALRLAAAMKDYRRRAQAQGLIALALVPTDRPAAARMLAEAYGTLERFVAEGKDEWNGLGAACTAAAGLLPVVEAVDPTLVREYLWRTLALRPPLRGPDGREGIADLSNAQVAVMLARYDRDAARAVLDAFAGPAVARLKRGLVDRNRSHAAGSVFTALAAVDPARAVAVVEALPEEPDASPQSLKVAARLDVAGVLSFDGVRRWEYLETSLLHLWRIGFIRY